jgi:hypothetical protein
MSNGVDDYSALFDTQEMTVGGAAGVLTVDGVPAGDALGAANSQQYAFQYGVRAPDDVFTTHAQVLAPFAGTTPTGDEAIGMYVGRGDQDNYVKLVVSANGGAPELQMVEEVDGVPTEVGVPVDLTDVTAVDCYLTVDKVAGTVAAHARVLTTAGAGELVDVGAAVPVPSTWVDGSTQGLAVGIIATSSGGSPFPATWSGLDVTLGPAE